MNPGRFGPRPPSPHVLIYGFYGASNFGDEAILEVLLSHLRGQGVSQISVVSYSPEATRSRHRVHAVPIWSVSERTRAVVRSTHVIFGGGGLLKNPRGSTSDFTKNLSEILLAHVLGRPVLVLGISVDELLSSRLHSLVRRALSPAHGIWIRDSDSRRRLLSYGLPPQALSSGADLTFAKAPSLTKRRARTAPKTLGLNLAAMELAVAYQDRPSLESQLYSSLLEGLEALHRSGWETLLLISLRRVAALADLDHLASFSKRLPSSWNIQCLDLSDATLNEALEATRQVDFLIGMRFHAIAIALLHGTPFLALGIEDKVYGLIRDCGLPSNIVPVEDVTPSDFSATLVSAVRDSARINPQLLSKRARLARQAQHSLAAVPHFLARQPGDYRLPLASRALSFATLTSAALPKAWRPMSRLFPLRPNSSTSIARFTKC